MQASLSDYLDLLDPWIPPALISRPYLNSIKKIGAKLPAFSFGSFECLLGADQPRVDFNISINGMLNEHVVFSEWLASKGSGSGAANIWPIFREWEGEATPHLSQVRLIWFVYDLSNPGLQNPQPWLYAHLRRTIWDKVPQVRAEMIMQALFRLDPSHAPAYHENYRDFIETIPASNQIMAIGSPVTRVSSFLRIYLIIQTFQEIITFLGHYNWLGDIRELRDEIAKIDIAGSFYGLSFDLGHDLAIQPRIGIEIWFEDQQQLDSCAQSLVNHGLCTEEKRTALLRWKDEMVVETNLDLWSGRGPNLLSTHSEQRKILIQRMLRYIKVIYQPQRPLVAKAYLFFDRPSRQI